VRVVGKERGEERRREEGRGGEGGGGETIRRNGVHRPPFIHERYHKKGLTSVSVVRIMLDSS
jgi:hypothetical protein